MSVAVLVLAGHDPTGGAGVDADREALLATRTIARVVVTNHTQQDGVRVSRVEPVDRATWMAAARSAFDADVRVVKTGLLSSADQIDALAELVAQWRLATSDLLLVVDPVLAASGGEVFLDGPGRARLLERLVELRPVLTPNVLELAALTGADATELASDVAARERAARRLVELGAFAVCAKAGHGREDPLVDLVVTAGTSHHCRRPRLSGRSLHGSGCRHASFLAGRLAHGASLVDAAEAAGVWLQSRLQSQA